MHDPVQEQSGSVLQSGLRGAMAASALLWLAACATVPPGAGETSGDIQSVQILALNDFHGHLEQPSNSMTWQSASGERQERLGGAANMGVVLGGLRAAHGNTVTVAAGDLIGASPLASAYHLDEPAIMALNRIGLEIAAVGNHEFDRGIAELQRMQRGGCEKFTAREPCVLDRPFEGARFAFLAGNVLDERGDSLFPGTALRDFGAVRIGFIGLTLEETGTLVSPAGTAGYRFADEADTANTLAAQLRTEGADAIVLLIHQGGYASPIFSEQGCDGLEGPILPILERLSDEIRLIISGHTHAAYVCELEGPGGGRLLTSAGRHGAFVTDIRLQVDPRTDRVVAMEARNVPVTGMTGEQQDVAALVERYVRATEPIAARVVGRIEGPLGGFAEGTGSPLGALIADAQLAATQDPARGSAQIAFMNSGGVRGRLTPGDRGELIYGQLFAVQPFGNTLVVLEMSGAQIREALEQQFTDETPATIQHSLLLPSRGFHYAYDPDRADGERIVSFSLGGAPIEPGHVYRVTVSNFLASGGDGFSAFAEATAVADGGVDLDALQAYVAQGIRAPDMPRIAVQRP